MRTEQQHNERKQEIMENALNAMRKKVLPARELRHWQRPATVLQETCRFISKTLTN